MQLFQRSIYFLYRFPYEIRSFVRKITIGLKITQPLVKQIIKQIIKQLVNKWLYRKSNNYKEFFKNTSKYILLVI